MRSRLFFFSLLALLTAGQTALAETVTYTISGHKELTTSYLTVTASGSVTGTANDSWDITSTSARTVTLPGCITFNFGSDKTTSMAVESGTLRIQASGSTGGYITLSHDSKYIYHVTLKDDSNNVFHEAWNMEKSYTHRFQAIYVKTIVVEYADKIPITDAVISGIDNSYVVSDTPVMPVPTVTWHATSLTKNTHYTLSYQNSSAAGTATVKATGKGIFSTSTNVSANYTLNWATYTVRFNANGGSGTMADQAFTYNTAQALSANAFTRIGYTFDGWSTTANGTVAYTNGQSVSNLTAANGTTVDLFAQWTPISWERDGSGTADDPYRISNYAELKQFANIVNSTGGEAYAKIEADIVCKNGPADMEYATDWVPIGNASQPYTGTFDGQGYTITGLSTPTGNSSNYVGLFGYMGSGGVVKDVILEDATITGNNYVGIIAGYNNNGTLSHNYYVSCSVNSAATNIGTGSGDCDGARSLFTITLPEGVTAATATVTLDYTDYYIEGTTVTLSYSDDLPNGYTVSYSYNDGSDHAITGNTFTMPAANVTVSAQWVLDSSVKYIDSNGIEQVCSNYTIIQSSNSSQTLGDTNNKEAWYAVVGNITVGGALAFNDKAVHLIICDGATLTITADDTYAIFSLGKLTIYGQLGGTGAVSASASANNSYDVINVANEITINGGIISAICGANGEIGIFSGAGIVINDGSVTATTGRYGIMCNSKITVNGGTVTAAGRVNGISTQSTVFIYGGTVTATSTSTDNGYGISAGDHINLGWTHISDSITASSYNKTPILLNQCFIDDDGSVYDSSNISSSAIAGKTLRPYLKPSTAQAFTLTQGTKDGITAWWATYYNASNYFLSEGAAAYTLGGDYKLYRLGTDGRTIPRNTAVVIIASEATIQIYDIGPYNISVTDHAPGGNILQGSDSAVTVSGLSGTPYVLSKDANGTIGFREYTGTEIPAKKAYYVVQPTP